MLPPVVLDPITAAWRCHRCGHCCRAWRIDVAAPKLRNMADCCVEARDHQSALRLLAELHSERRVEGACALPTKADGACYFLDGDECRFRAQHGDEQLPIACLKFPHLGLITPERRLLGLSFACPAALELLAAQRRLELDEDYEGRPPIEVLCDLRGDDDGEPNPAAAQFWSIHWRWWIELRAARGTTVQRLRQLAEQVAEVRLPALRVAPQLWTAAALDAAAAQPLLEQGAAESVLATMYQRWTLHDASTQQTEGTDDDGDALLGRYLEHRLMVPEFLMTGASLPRLLGVLFALAARYRIERARGHDAPAAIARLDQLALHSDFVAELFDEPTDETEAWRTLALLALAET